MRRTLQRALLIVVAGTALGLVANTLSPRRIPYITPPKKVLKAEDSITLEQAQAVWSTGAAFFLDARSPEDYAAGHIANAFNLPAEAFEENFPKVAPMLTPETALVAYCDGDECELSHRMVEKLRQFGFTNVRILTNGWTAWSLARLPVEKGGPK